VTLAVMSPREASIFACLADTVIEPEPALPAVRDTDAVEFFDVWLARSPAPTRLAIRALLYLVELSPLAYGFGTRLRRLDRERRGAWFRALDRPVQVRYVSDLLKAISQLAYYGSDDVLVRLGYDPEANLARARAVRGAAA
jgi:hypothetical protein